MTEILAIQARCLVPHQEGLTAIDAAQALAKANNVCPRDKVRFLIETSGHEGTTEGQKIFQEILHKRLGACATCQLTTRPFENDFHTSSLNPDGSDDRLELIK